MIGYIGAAASTAAIAVAIWANLPTKLTMPIQRAQLQYLAKATLTDVEDPGSPAAQSSASFLAEQLWQNSGAVIMVEASRISSLRPQLDASRVPLYAVVHENMGIKEFRKYFAGQVYLDKERRFYGPNERWMGALNGFLRPSVWLNIYRAKKGGFNGNMEGEGRLLGGVFVIGKQEQGILLEFRESEWGAQVNLSELSEAVKKINA